MRHYAPQSGGFFYRACYNDRVSIQDIGRRFKSIFLDEELFLAALIVTVAGASFVLGRASIGNEEPQNQVGENTERFTVRNISGSELESHAVKPIATHGSIVASKNGSKYHYPWCASASQIKEENKLWFDSIDAARDAGYTPAANCKGLE